MMAVALPALLSLSSSSLRWAPLVPSRAAVAPALLVAGMLRLQHQSSPEPIQWPRTPPGSYGPLPSPSTSLRSSWQTVEPPSLSPPYIPFPLRQIASSPPHPLASLPPYLRVPSLSHPAAPEPPLRGASWASAVPAPYSPPALPGAPPSTSSSGSH
ncbi:hypothetical protein PF007_g8313 [Phytophthora fragariae]|uniref:RxLR effector protein n=1 Tax=Phytophthora fragariae TaxID=53985 RepID=A0A6A3SMZ9_9STRA|nr:hypothetical protein PF007_g8313 [Phytophthora fragariae]KAE9260973.1 hypothetical protein PF001_g32559 [Phytophthora fragariae]